MKAFLTTLLIIVSLIFIISCGRSDNKEQLSSVNTQEQELVSTPTPTPLIEHSRIEKQSLGIYDFKVYQDEQIQSVHPDAYRKHVEKRQNLI